MREPTDFVSHVVEFVLVAGKAEVKIPETYNPKNFIKSVREHLYRRTDRRISISRVDDMSIYIRIG